MYLLFIYLLYLFLKTELFFDFFLAAQVFVDFD